MDFGRLIIFILAFIGGILIMKNTVPIVKIVGRSSWAEKYLGTGGTYSMWSLIGVAIILIGFLYFMGVIDLSPDEAEQRQINSGDVQIID